MNAEFDNSRPIYEQLIERLKSAIAKGEYAPGEKIPPVRELAVMCKVNPNTMQRALAKLEDMKLLQSERTTGRFVTTDTAVIARLQSDLPAALTGAYVQAMGDAGVEAARVVEYVREHIGLYINETAQNGIKNNGAGGVV